MIKYCFSIQNTLTEIKLSPAYLVSFCIVRATTVKIKQLEILLLQKIVLSLIVSSCFFLYISLFKHVYFEFLWKPLTFFWLVQEQVQSFQ